MPDTLRWRDNIITSVRIPDGWVEVRGDVLECGNDDCISVRRVVMNGENAWRLTHLPTGQSIVSLPDQRTARGVAEQIVAAAPQATWAAEEPAVAAAHLRDVLTPIHSGRRCHFMGQRLAGWGAHRTSLR